MNKILNSYLWVNKVSSRLADNSATIENHLTTSTFLAGGWTWEDSKGLNSLAKDQKDCRARDSSNSLLHKFLSTRIVASWADSTAWPLCSRKSNRKQPENWSTKSPYWMGLRSTDIVSCGLVESSNCLTKTLGISGTKLASFCFLQELSYE